MAAIGLCLAQGAQVAGLSIVAGNVTLAQAVQNATVAAEVFGWTMPIHPGAAAPLSGELQTAAYVLGADGMPSVSRRLPVGGARPVPVEDAVPAMMAWLRAGGGRVLALGPLTNLAHLALRAPNLVRGLEVVWMGGAFARGNHTAVAEFNAAVDPEAIEVVLRTGVNLLMVGLECCREVQVTLNDLPPLRAIAGEKAALLADLYEGYIRIAADGTRPMALYDPVAAALALDPALSQQEEVFLAAELRGVLTRGMTVIEWRRHKAVPNARVATAPNAAIIRTQFHAALIRMAKA